MPQLVQRVLPAFIFLCCLVVPQLLRAQGCLLVPVPLAQRTQQAALVVEARVTSQQPERAPNGHIVTRHQLEVYKVFRGQLPAGSLSVLTPGGFLGEQGEVVSGSPTLQAGQQGIFFLEADPNLPGERRTYAGPQGFIEYDLATLSAREPFGRYASISGTLYSNLAAQVGTSYREVAANASLAAATQRLAQRTAAGPLTTTAPTISSFSPSAVTAGTSTSTDASTTGVLTISGAGFGATQGAGYVQFRNADNPGADTAPNFTKPLASDYLSWSNTQIEVRVPAYSATGNAAGTGNFQVFENGGTSATSPSQLTVTYNLLNTSYSTASGDQTYRIHLIDTDGNGGYSLHYSPSFTSAPGSSAADAKTAFETALRTWHCTTNMNRTIAAATTIDVATQGDLSVVRFAAANELPTGVLGVTNSYYKGCGTSNGSTIMWTWALGETDYTFAPVPYPGYTWNFTANAPTQFQYDFQSVVLHELGHGEQLGHIISSTGVMNWSIPPNTAKRTLDAGTDIAAAQNIINYSLNNTSYLTCASTSNPPAKAFTTSSCPLPVVLTAFTARYQPGQGTRLNWATASEAGSLAFVIESQDDPATGTWQEVGRVAAAGSSPTPRQYANLDARPLAGTRYYRLRQLDSDGRVAYSAVVAITATATELAAYPNPATGLVHLSGPLASGATAQVRLLTTTGSCWLRTSGPAGQAAFDLPVGGVPAGLYLVEWDGGAGRRYLRLVIGNG